MEHALSYEDYQHFDAWLQVHNYAYAHCGGRINVIWPTAVFLQQADPYLGVTLPGIIPVLAVSCRRCGLMSLFNWEVVFGTLPDVPAAGDEEDGATRSE